MSAFDSGNAMEYMNEYNDTLSQANDFKEKTKGEVLMAFGIPLGYKLGKTLSGMKIPKVEMPDLELPKFNLRQILRRGGDEPLEAEPQPLDITFNNPVYNGDTYFANLDDPLYSGEYVGARPVIAGEPDAPVEDVIHVPEEPPEDLARLLDIDDVEDTAGEFDSGQQTSRAFMGARQRPRAADEDLDEPVEPVEEAPVDITDIAAPTAEEAVGAVVSADAPVVADTFMIDPIVGTALGVGLAAAAGIVGLMDMFKSSARSRPIMNEPQFGV